MAKRKTNTRKTKRAPTDRVPVPSSKQEREWQIEEDVRTLTRAAEVKRDSRRFKAAEARVKRMLADLKNS